MLTKIANKIILFVIFVAYVIALVFQMIYFVPYEKVATFISAQNVPHTIVMENGYTSIIDGIDDRYTSIAELEQDEYLQSEKGTIISKRIDTAQIVTNVIVTTLIAGAIYGAIYFLFIFKKEKEYIFIDEQETKKHLPILNFEELAFADPETQEKTRKDYEDAIYRYVKSKIENR